MTHFMTLKFRRRSDENAKSSTAVRYRAVILINILLIFYCGNSGDGRRFQTVNVQRHIQGYMHFYLHAPHSATIIQLFLHFFNPSLRIKKNALCGDHASVYLSVCLWPNTIDETVSRIFMKFRVYRKTV
jgi:hypothetical protein